MGRAWERLRRRDRDGARQPEHHHRRHGVGGTGADLLTCNATGWGFDQIFGFSIAGGDERDFRGSGLSFAKLTVYEIQASSVVTHVTDRIDVHCVASPAQFGFLFV